MGRRRSPPRSGGRYLVIGGARCRLPDIAVVVPLHCPPGVPVFEDVHFRGGRGCIHRVPADELDRPDHSVGFWGRSHEEDVVDVLGGRSRAGGVLCRLGERWGGAVLPEAAGGRRSVHGCNQDVFCQPFDHEVFFPFQVSGDGGFRL